MFFQAARKNGWSNSIRVTKISTLCTARPIQPLRFSSLRHEQCYLIHPQLNYKTTYLLPKRSLLLNYYKSMWSIISATIMNIQYSQMIATLYKRLYIVLVPRWHGHSYTLSGGLETPNCKIYKMTLPVNQHLSRNVTNVITSIIRWWTNLK